MGSTFRFKHFEMQNHRSAMKVSTDGVLLGAWAPLSAVSGSARTVWDVGTGSGLIALMAAQLMPMAHIYGIEIEESAASESAENFEHSPWADRLTPVHADINDVASTLPAPDMIISNPPYYDNTIVAPDAARRQARHQASLSYDALMHLAADYMAADGELCVISPEGRRDDIIFSAAACGLQPMEVVEIMTSSRKPVSRLLWRLSRKSVPLHLERHALFESGGTKTEYYDRLTRDFYL